MTTDTPTPVLLGVPEALAALEQIVNTLGSDFVYAAVEHGRQYHDADDLFDEYGDPYDKDYAYSTNEGTGSCIVGRVCEAVTPDFFKWLESEEQRRGHPFIFEKRGTLGSQSLDSEGYAKVQTPGIPYTDEAIRVLRVAQVAQDGGATYGDALEAARNEAEARGYSV
jgi:hypothetical protein